MMPIASPDQKDEVVNQPKGRGSRAIALSMLSRVVMIGVNVATGMITARALAPTGRGEQAAMILWPVLLSYATSFGLPASLSYFLKRSPEKKSELLSSALILGLALSALSGVIAAVLMPRLLGHYDDQVILAARLFLLYLPMGTFSFLARAALEADDKFGVSIWSQLLTPALTLVMLLAFLVVGRLTPITAAMSYTLNGLPVSLWLWGRLRKSFRVSFLNPIPLARKLLTYGLPAYGIDLCGTLAGNVDQAMVVNFLEPKAMGIYAVAISVSRMVNLAQSSVTMVLLPKAAGSDPDQAVALTAKAARASAFLTALVALAVLIVSPIATRLLYGTDFLPAVGPIRVLTIEALIGGTVMVLAQAPMALGRPALVTTLQMCGLAFTIPLMFILLPRLGLLGAALALLISTCMRLVLMLGCFPLVLKYPIPRLLLSREEFSHLLQIGWEAIGYRRASGSS